MKIWKEVLLYQFHDILPGSSIKRVYDESITRYKLLKEKVENIRDKAYRFISSKLRVNDTIVYNSLSFDRNEIICINNKWYNITIPSMGYSNVTALSEIEQFSVYSKDNVIGNNLIEVEFADDGSIISIFDKKAKREAICGKSNKFVIYHDEGDAWDIEIGYEEKKPEYMILMSSNTYIEGPRVVTVQKYIHGDTTLTQKISVTDGSERVDFETYVDWHESLKMMRAEFDIDVDSQNLVCGIQFGNIKRPTYRNTSWDEAKFEICAQKWVDLTEKNFGVALLDNCKYGHSINRGHLTLNLLRSPCHPGINADIGNHNFKYSIYTHVGDSTDALVYEEAEKINVPIYIMGNNISDKLVCKSFVKIEKPAIIADTIKGSENGDGIIIRLYEASGNRNKTRISVDFGKEIMNAQVVNMLEKTEGADCKTGLIDVSNGIFELSFDPFEIKTILLKF